MKAVVVVFLFFIFEDLKAGIATPLETMKIQLSSGYKVMHAFGRVVPDVGSLKVQLSEVKGRIYSVQVHNGQKIKRGNLLMKYSGPSCYSKSPCDISSGFDGIVDEILKIPGADIETGQGLVSFLNPEGVVVRLDVPIKYLKFINVGQKITLRSSENGAASSVKAQVFEVETS